MIFNEQVDLMINGKLIVVDMSFEGDAKCVHYSPAHTNCVADNASDMEIEFEYERVDLSDIDFQAYNEDGKLDVGSLQKEDAELLCKEIVSSANTFIENFEWSI